MMFKIILMIVLIARNNAYEFDVGNFLKSLGHDEYTTPFQDLPQPIDVVLDLDEEEFEDYLEFWLKKQLPETYDLVETKEDLFYKDTKDCKVPIKSLTEPQPVYVYSGNLKLPIGKSGNLVFAAGENVTVACAGRRNYLVHPNTTLDTEEETIVCRENNKFFGFWLTKLVDLYDIKCNIHVPWVETKVAGNCAIGGSTIEIAVQSNTTKFTTITACFNEARSESLYVKYSQNVENMISQVTGNRPSFKQGQWFPGLVVDDLYSPSVQKDTIEFIVGKEMANKYINNTNFLARGHLAAKSDFILSPSQRATFTFINVAPQWQPFNGGNWNKLEQDLRSYIGTTNRRTTIYTGTWGILQLKNSQGIPKDIYLSPNDTRIPVPLWYWKVVHDEKTHDTTAFLGLNNPHVTLNEAKNLGFCSDICNKQPQLFNWLTWKASDIKYGYSLCCEINDFRKTVTTLPSFKSEGIFH